VASFHRNHSNVVLSPAVTKRTKRFAIVLDHPDLKLVFTRLTIVDLNVNLQAAAQQIDLTDDSDFQSISLTFSHLIEEAEINDREFKPTPGEVHC